MKKGTVLALLKYARVKEVLSDGTVFVEDLDDGLEFGLRGKDLLGSVFSADAVEQEKEVSRTKLVQVLTEAGDKPFTVTFVKSDGSERTLVGRYAGTETIFGRSNVIDLEIPADQHRLRQVDHRTITSIIFDGVRYTLK